MTKQFKQALEALAKAGGFTGEYACTYCRENCHSEDTHELHQIVTFIGPAEEE